MPINIPETDKKRVVIAGAGFAGLTLARKLIKLDLEVVLLDRNNYHQFQPLFYQVATAGFSEAILNDPASGSSRFFLGITYIAMNEFNQAIDMLDGVANQQGDYTKDARWYLGLAYLKTGNKAKASECFELLAQTSGFYRKRSERTLRLLK